MKRYRKAAAWLLGLGLLLWFCFCLPSTLFKVPQSRVLEDRDGNLLGAGIASDGQWRFPSDAAVPEKFGKCIVTFEDRHFYYHPGFDPVALARAAYADLRAGRYVRGGSTLSMQVIRLSMHRKRTIVQKVLEIIMAIRLEFSYSKAHILALYASNAPFGTNVIGLEAASWRYFGRRPASLSWGEMAALAVLPNSPSLVHPGRNRDRLIQKRNRLLRALAQRGIIDLQTCHLAMAEPVPDKPHVLPQIAPHLLARFSSNQNAENPEPSRLRSTIKLHVQEQLNAALEKYAATLRSREIGNAAALVLDVESGAVLAYAGNTWHPDRPEYDSQVDVIQSARSPGSTLKPILYTLMMQEGFILPKTLIPDVPTYISGFNPQNFDLGYDGAVPANQALSRSLNIPAVRMLNLYKYPRFYDKLRGLGFNTMNRGADNYGLSMILGGAETNLWELCGAYASMARTLSHYNRNGGLYDPADLHAPIYSWEKALKTGYLASIEKNTGSSHILQKSGFMDAGALWYTFQAMEEVARPGEEAWWRQFSSAYRLSWKTGTSFGFRDGWAIGLTPGYVVGVWVGNTSGEGRPGLTGISAAAPLLFDIFHFLPQVKWFEKPLKAFTNTEVCRESGFKAGPNCKDTYFEEVPLAGSRSALCPWHVHIHTNLQQSEQLDASCAATTELRDASWFVLPPVMEYYYRLRHPSYKSLPPWNPKCGLSTSSPGAALDLIYPLENSQIYIPIEISGKRGRLICSAALRNTGTQIFWNLDSKFIGSTRDFNQIAIAPEAGRHTLTLLTRDGDRLERHFEILEKKESR